jgi:predicted RNA binding protein YcfA (HicA-like mRNA interferase family)
VDHQKLLARALSRPASLHFAELVSLTEAFGFSLARTSGSHHIFTHPELPELINLQDAQGMAKPYQVRQLLRLVERYNLQLERD